jgi:hypothetical protein
MEGVLAHATGPLLSALYTECVRSFGLFLSALSEENCRVIHLEQVHLTAMLEEYGRVKIWGSQSKADIPARARGSLDDEIRHDDELKNLVRSIFFRLRALLDQGKLLIPPLGLFF